MRELDIIDCRKYEFTRNWFRNRNLATFREYVYPQWAGQRITYLEIGVFEGMSMLWMCQRVLTHPESRAVGIDPWLITRLIDEEYMNQVCERAKRNLVGFNVTLQRGNSYEVLRRMIGKNGFLGIRRESVDICLIDGNHFATGVLDDLRLATRLVRTGGWVLMDDVENQIPKTNYVKEGLQAYLAESCDLKQVFKHRFMEGYEKCL